MFTGIIESLGTIVKLQEEGTNLHLTIESPISSELKIDQSVAHNGVCLTVVEVKNNTHTVTAIDETLQKTNVHSLKIADKVNLERCLKLGDRLDGHIVQGHVDSTAICTEVQEKNGSWVYTFQYPKNFANLLVEKGSVCVNGTSLTCFNLLENTFQVAIIPYTYEHTNIHTVKSNSIVNIEFDIIGKYAQRRML